MNKELLKLINELYLRYIGALHELDTLIGKEKYACRGFLNCLEMNIKSLLQIAIEEN